MTTVWEWMNVIGDKGAAIIAATPYGEPAAVIYGNPNATIGPDECCEGIIGVGWGRWTPTGETWPNPVSPHERPKLNQCGGNRSAVSVTMEYTTCIPVFGEGHAAPTVADRNMSARKLATLADAVWTEFGCAIPDWCGQYGQIRRTSLTPIPVQATCGGFEIAFTVAVPSCCDDD